jgi:hypothetical protein
MKPVLLTEGANRTRVNLTTSRIGNDLIVYLFNDQGHIGAVAVSDYADQENRSSTSVITRLGHKDDSVAYRAAHRLCKKLKQPVCVIAGIHVDDISGLEIAEITDNCDKLVDTLLSVIGG